MKEGWKDSGTPPGCRIVFCRFPGVSMLDPRLISDNPPGFVLPFGSISPCRIKLEHGVFADRVGLPGEWPKQVRG